MKTNGRPTLSSMRVIAFGLDGDGLRRLAVAAIQEGVSGRSRSARIRFRIVHDADERSNRIFAIRPSECRKILVTFRPARRVAGLPGTYVAAALYSYYTCQRAEFRQPTIARGKSRTRPAIAHAHEWTCSPPQACHARSKWRASSSERDFTPISMPPSRRPTSYCSMISFEMPNPQALRAGRLPSRRRRRPRPPRRPDQR